MTAEAKVTPRERLGQIVFRWEEEARYNVRDCYPYLSALSEILFHADLRFFEYIQFQNEGEFAARLTRWLDNVTSEREKQGLFRLLTHLIFIDQRQMRSLCREAYKRVVVPWITRNWSSPAEFLAEDYELQVRSQLSQYLLCSITESFNWDDFLQVNDLLGLQKPRVLSEDPRRISSALQADLQSVKGLIVLEDFVGTGHQASGVLAQVRANTPSNIGILFAPLIILDGGLETLVNARKTSDFTIDPILVMAKDSRIEATSQQGEPQDFPYIRAVVTSAAQRVCRELHNQDDPPDNPFGYGGSGSLIVTKHNTPNNTLPLIHHRAPDWNPLFRRLHHSKDGL